MSDNLPQGAAFRRRKGELGEVLRRSPTAVRLKRRLERHWRGQDDVSLVDDLPIFAPYSAGSYHDRVGLTVQCAQQIFPLLASLAESSGHETPSLIDIESFNVDGDEHGNNRRLKELLDQYGSDKATDHNYHLLYSQVLGDPAAISAVVEIGLGTNNEDVVSSMGADGRPGASLRAFRDYLPNAMIYGADIDVRVLFSEERISTCFIDQTDPSSFTELAQLIGDGVDLIIDDGLHSPNANIAILAFGLDRIRVGGWIVIEDIAPAAEPLWQAVTPLLPARHRAVLLRARGGLLFAVQRMS